MNDFIKKHKVSITVSCIIIAAFATWLLFRDIRSDRRTAGSVRTEFDSTAREQQQAADALESVQSGLDNSKSTVGRIEQSNNNAQSTTDRIAESNNAIKESVGNAAAANNESSKLIGDSQRRVSESLSVIQEIRKGTGKDAR